LEPDGGSHTIIGGISENSEILERRHVLTGLPVTAQLLQANCMGRCGLMPEMQKAPRIAPWGLAT